MFRYINFLIFFSGILTFLFILYRTITIPGSFLYYLKFKIIILLFCSFIYYLVIFKKKFTKEFPLVFFSLILSFYLLEILSYTYLRNSNNEQYKENLYNFFELNKKQKNNLTVFYRNLINVDEKNYLAPLSGISKRHTILCNENGYFAEYFSDRYGFRNNDKVWDEGFDWVLLGDSFVHGSCVNQNDTIHNHLEKKLSKNILNLSIVGNSGYTQLGSYLEYLQNYNPKNIIWFYYEGNDFRLNVENIYGNLVAKYLEDNYTQDLINKQNIIDKGLDKIFKIKLKEYKNKKKISFIKFVNLRLFLNQIFPKLNLVKKNNHLIFKTQPNSEEIEKLKKIIKKIKLLTSINNQNLYFVYLPSFQRYFNKERTYDETYFNKSEIINILSEDGFKVIDIHYELFSHLKEPLKLFPYKNRKGHYTPNGYELVSNIIQM